MLQISFQRKMCYEKTQSCTTKSTVWIGYNYVFQVLHRLQFVYVILDVIKMICFVFLAHHEIPAYDHYCGIQSSH